MSFHVISVDNPANLRVALGRVAINGKKQRAAYAYFRRKLLENGFHQMQFSVYHRHFSTKSQADAEAKKLGQFVPTGGKVSFLFLTDKQFGMTLSYFGNLIINDELEPPEQLLLF